MSIVFFGTADLAAHVLKVLVEDSPFSIQAAVSQPDRPRGRSMRLQPTPVKRIAEEKKIPVLQPRKARDVDFLQQLEAIRPDLIVVAAYGQILPESVLSLPPHGCLNVHTSLLPKYRGAAPIQWALLEGERVTGATIMKMDAGMDTGPIVLQREIPVEPDDDGGTLHDKLAELGARLMIEAIPPYLEGRLQPVPQHGEDVSYARKIRKEDGRIDWTRPAEALSLQIRGLTPWPGTFTSLPDSMGRKTLKVWKAALELTIKGAPGQVLETSRDGILAAAGEGALWIQEVQIEGGRRMLATQFLQGHPLKPGHFFSS